MRGGPKTPTTTKQGRAYIRRHPLIVAVPATEPYGLDIALLDIWGTRRQSARGHGRDHPRIFRDERIASIL